MSHVTKSSATARGRRTASGPHPKTDPTTPRSDACTAPKPDPLRNAITEYFERNVGEPLTSVGVSCAVKHLVPNDQEHLDALIPAVKKHLDAFVASGWLDGHEDLYCRLPPLNGKGKKSRGGGDR